MRVYLDDRRPAPPGWERVYDVDGTIRLLRTGEVIELSLDFDLGDRRRGTGLDVLVWIEREVAAGRLLSPRLTVHSSHPTGRTRMLAYALAAGLTLDEA